MENKIKSAAVSYIEREDGRILCVWGRRYGTWSMPGGLVEEGEAIQSGQARELLEETSLDTIKAELIYEFDKGAQGKNSQNRASYIYIFQVTPEGIARETEVGAPVTWLTREEFLKWSLFAEYYVDFFNKYPSGQFTVLNEKLPQGYLSVSDAWTERKLIIEHLRKEANGYLDLELDSGNALHWTADSIENCDHRRIK